MDDTSRILTVQDYWYTDDTHADLVEGIYKDGEGPFEQLFLPSPEIQRVKILDSREEENHGSHPEHGQTFPTIDQWYEDKIKLLNK